MEPECQSVWQASYGRADRVRTCDLLVPNQARYQLRYGPTPEEYSRAAGFCKA